MFPTIVSCFFDLRKGVSQERSPNGDEIKKKMKYFHLAKDFILQLPYPLILFTDDDELIEYIHLHRKFFMNKTKIHKMNFEDLYFQKYAESIQKNKLYHKIMNECPIKDTVPYIILNYNKFDFLEKAILQNPFGSTHFVWMDFGINHIASNTEEIHEWILQVTDSIRQLCINPYYSNDNNHRKYFTMHYHNMAGGLFSGSIENLLKYKELFEIKLQQILEEGWYQNDEAIMTLIEYENPKIFNLYYGDYQGIVSNYQIPIHNIPLIIDGIHKSIFLHKTEKIYHMITFLIPFFQKKENRTHSFYYTFLDLHIQLDHYYHHQYLQKDILYFINQDILHFNKKIYEMMEEKRDILSKYKNKDLLLPIPKITDLQISTTDPFQWIDKIICLSISNGKISHDEYLEKIKEMEIPIHKVVFLKDFSQEPIDQHIEALQLSVREGFQNVWILEDVMKWNITKEELHSYFSYFYSNFQKWDVCMLSFNITSPTHKVEEIPNEPFVQKIKFAQNATSYIVHSSYISILLTNMLEAKTKLQINHEHWLYNHDVYWKILQNKDHWFSFDKHIVERKI